MSAPKTYGGLTLAEILEDFDESCAECSLARDLVQAQEKLAKVTALANVWAMPDPLFKSKLHHSPYRRCASELRAALSDTPPTGGGT